MKKANQSELLLEPHPSHIDENKLFCLGNNRQSGLAEFAPKEKLLIKTKLIWVRIGKCETLINYRSALKSIISRR